MVLFQSSREGVEPFGPIDFLSLRPWYILARRVSQQGDPLQYLVSIVLPRDFRASIWIRIASN